MIGRLFLIIPLCIILSGCSRSYYEETGLDEISVGEDVLEASGYEGTGDTDTTDDANEIYVYVCGQVESPGVYKLPSGSRVFEVLSSAGGVTKDADIAFINQAESCYDGERIYVPSIGEQEAGFSDSGVGTDSDGRVNINTADSVGLQQLKGIGASRAEDIISYRESNGAFTCIEDIMKVPGIKQGTFNKIKEQIKV